MAHHLPPLGRSHYKSTEFWQQKHNNEPTNPRAHRFLAPLFMERAKRGVPGAMTQAFKHLKASAYFSPNDENARNDYAVALLRVNKVDQAIAEFLVGLKNDPESPFLHKNLASAYARQGKFKQALVHAREATRLDPADPLAHRNLARLLDATGNTRDSLTHNRIAVHLGPGHLTAGRARDAHDTDAYRTVARQTVARNEYANGVGFAEEHFDAYRALAGKRVDMPFSEATKDLLQRAGLEPT